MDYYDNSEYRKKARDEEIMRGKNHVDIEILKELVAVATQGPWHWVEHDYSMASIEGPADEWDHVMSVSPCSACRERSKNEGEEWKWGRCTCPSEANAKLLALAPAMAEALIEKSKYPMKVANHVWQYGEGTFIWENEVQQWGGVAHTLEEANNQMEQYAKTL